MSRKAKSGKQNVTIIGSGLTGLFMTILLAKRGYSVDIYERYSEKDVFENSSRRSFNITFYGYGIQALKEAGLFEAVKPVLLPLKGNATQVLPHADYTYSRFDDKEMLYYGVSRADLLTVLFREARKFPHVRFHFQTPPVYIDRNARTMTVKHLKTGTQKTVKCDVILGADGVNSMVRSCIQQGRDARHRQESVPWTYKQVSFPPEVMKKLKIPSNMACSWTRKHGSLIGFHQKNGVFGALMMLPKDKKHGHAALNTPAKIKSFVTGQFPTLLPALDIITHDLMNNPESHFVTVFSEPWYYKDFMAILGDAPHGFLPFNGMGTATGFGDCLCLVNLMDTYGPDWGKIFPLYQEARKKNTDVLGKLSIQSLSRFIRHTRADYEAVYDRLETLLNKLFPKIWHPSLFQMVAHDPMNAHVYARIHERQRKISRYIGISFAVSTVTAALAVQEKLAKLPTFNEGELVLKVYRYMRRLTRRRQYIWLPRNAA